jgi:hypothetical protein
LKSDSRFLSIETILSHRTRALNFRILPTSIYQCCTVRSQPVYTIWL